MKLADILELPTAERYPRAGNPGDLLPHVYGDFLSTGLTSADEDIGGATPAVLIDIDTWTYCVNGLPSATATPLVYVEDVRQESSVFTYTPAIDYASTGHEVAIITFLVNPAGRRISVRMQGAVDDSGALIRNPITALQHAFTEIGDWQASDFDRSSVPDARRTADAMGYPVHWCFGEHRTYKEWLTDLLLAYHGDHFLTPQGTLGVVIPTETPPPPEAIIQELDARQHLDLLGQGDPERAITYELDVRNLVNRAILRYQYRWDVGQYGQEQTFTDAKSLSRYGTETVATKEFTLPGIRTATHAERWARMLFARYARDPMLVSFAVRSLRYMHLMPPQHIALTCRSAPTVDGAGWSRRILKILNTTYQWRPVPRVELEAFDTRIDLRETSYLILKDQDEGVWYAYVEAGTLVLDDTNHPEVALNITPYYWIERQSPDNTTHYLYPIPEGELIADTDVPAVGTGIATPLALVDEVYRAWDVLVTDPPESAARIRRAA